MRTTCPSLKDCLHERCVWTSYGCIPGPSSCHTQLGVSDFDSIARCFWYWRSGDMKELHMTLVGVKSISKNNSFPILVSVIHRDMCWSFYDIDGTAICLKFPRVWISRLDSMNWRNSPPKLARRVELLAWLSIVQAGAIALHCCIAFAMSRERRPCILTPESILQDDEGVWRIYLTQNTLPFASLCEGLKSLPKDLYLHSNLIESCHLVKQLSRQFKVLQILYSGQLSPVWACDSMSMNHRVQKLGPPKSHRLPADRAARFVKGSIFYPFGASWENYTHITTCQWTKISVSYDFFRSWL